MADTMSRPELREHARQHACAINRDPAVRKRQNRGKRRKQQLTETTRIPGHADQAFLQLLAREAATERAP
jgi:hypothetical protein